MLVTLTARPPGVPSAAGCRPHRSGAPLEDSPSPHEACPRQAGDRLHPAQDFLDALTRPLAQPIPLRLHPLAGSTTRPAGRVLRHDGPLANRDVRAHAAVLQLQEEGPVVESFVCTKGPGRQSVTPTHVFEHLLGTAALGLPVSGVHPHVQAQPMAILHEDVPAVVEQSLFALAFTQQSRFRVGGREVARVGTCFPMKADGGIAGVRFVALELRAVPPLEALQARPAPCASGVTASTAPSASSASTPGPLATAPVSSSSANRGRARADVWACLQGGASLVIAPLLLGDQLPASESPK